jgi:hypothetical protein
VKESRTYKMPPLVATNMVPEDVYNREEMQTLKDWLAAVLWARGPEDFEKGARPFTKERRASIARMLAEIRTQGYYPDRLDEHGNIVWGVALKSEVQIEMERNADKYYRRGEEARREGLEILRTMEKAA